MVGQEMVITIRQREPACTSWRSKPILRASCSSSATSRWPELSASISSKSLRQNADYSRRHQMRLGDDIIR